jgi:hypothetical protein
MTLFSSRFLPLLVLPLAACWYAGHSNGATGNLEFSGLVESGGTKLAFPVEVTRYPDQWQSICSAPSSFHSADGVRPQGGDPCLGGEVPLKNTPITLVAAQCDDNACTVQDASAGATKAGDVRLLVTPVRAGNLTLRVKVRANDGSGTWDDVCTYPVVDVGRIGFQHPAADDATTAFGVLVGTPVTWTPHAYDSSGHELSGADEAFAVSWDDGAIAKGASGSLQAIKMGRGTATLKAAGLEATEVVQVIDPNTTVAMEVRRAVADADSSGDVSADPSTGGALGAIVLDNAQAGPFLVVLTLADGTRALGGALWLKVTGGSDVFATPSSNAAYGWTFWINDRGFNPAVPWTLTGGIGSARLALPISRSWESADGGAVDPGEAGTGGGGDAGDAGAEGGSVDAGDAGDAGTEAG